MTGFVGSWSDRNLLAAFALAMTLPLLHEGTSSSIFARPPEECSVLIDCDHTQDQKLTSSDAAAYDYFGESVSVSGDTAVVGASWDDCTAGNDCGSAYVYRFDGSSWVQETKLTASDAAAEDGFGTSVSVSGDSVVVGAYLDDCPAGVDCGSAYVFRFDGSTWVEEAKLTASDAAAGDNFGYSISVSGDTAVVGAVWDKCTAGSKCGSAYVYRFDGSSWVEEARLTASDVAAGDRFGISTSLSGDTAVMGSYKDDCAAGEHCGSAYVFRFDGARWVEEAKLTASDAAEFDYFGVSVSVSGDTCFVGAFYDSCAAGYSCGSAYVYRFDGSSWVEEARLTASEAAEWDFFGGSVSVSGDTAVVGASLHDCTAGDYCGSAYVYRFDGSSWAEVGKLAASDAASYDEFGTSVSVSRNTAFVGAYEDDCAAGGDCGSAYVFDLAAADCNCNAIADKCEMIDCNENCNDDVDDIANLTSPDCNSNGIPDECEIDENSAAPGSPFFCDAAVPPAGLVWCAADCNNSGVPDECEMVDCNDNCIDDDADIANLTSRDCNANDIPDECEIYEYSTAPGSPFFCDLATPPAGLERCDHDCNTNGVPDTCELVGNDCNGDGRPDECGVLIDCDHTEDHKLTASDAAALARFGESVSISGDTAVVGAYLDDCSAGEECGSAYVYRFDGSSWVEEAKLTASGAVAYDHFGISVSVSEDTAIVGAYYDKCAAGDNCGAAYIYRFDGLNWVEEAKFTVSDATYADRFGWSVSVSGDTAVVGAFLNYCAAEPFCGSAYVYRFNGSGWVEEAKLTASDAGGFSDWFGYSVSVDGDTVVVGATRADSKAESSSGAAYVYRFDGSIWVEEAKLTASDAAQSDALGYSVSVSGATAVVGAVGGECTGSYNCGSAYVYRFDGSSWVEETKLTAHDGIRFDHFGHSVSVSGYTAAVGARRDDCEAGDDCGSAYVYRFDGSSWVEEAKLTASDAAEWDNFGGSVSVSGDTVFVGALGNDCAAGNACGAAYIFDLSADDCDCNAVADKCEMIDCNENCIDDADDIANLTSSDCNTNGIPDECEIVENSTAPGSPFFCNLADPPAGIEWCAWDCNESGVPDECELIDNDCNSDGVPDDCELLENDCDENGVPDECERVDCNENCVDDADDIANLTSTDCNANGLPDECEIDQNSTAPGSPFFCDPAALPAGIMWCASDCDDSGVPDECEMFDCNENCIDDATDLFNLTSSDCNANDIPDECEIGRDSTAPGSPFFCNPGAPPAGLVLCEQDCNDSGIPDECELVDNDCNSDGRPDECGVVMGCDKTENHKITASDAAAFDRFGRSVSVSGSTAVVGTVYRDCAAAKTCGSAYVYRFDGSSWVEEATLTASDAAEGDLFGVSVSVSGNTAVVGASATGYAAEPRGGSAYVYRFDGSSWVEEAKLTASDATDRNRFGFSVSVSGDTAVVGAYSTDCAAGSTCGTAYVYHFDGSSWVEVGKLTASDAAENDGFGYSVSVSGETAVVGAYGDDCATGGACGAVYVFRFDGSSWAEEAKLTAPNAGDYRFAYSVSVSGDRILVGALSHSAYVFRFDGESWVEEGRLIASNPADDYFGRPVSLSGDTAVVGALSHSVYVYRFDGSSWVEASRLTTSDGVEEDYFGKSISVSGDRVVVGAYETGCASGTRCGSAYVFDLSDGDCNCNAIADKCEMRDCNSNGIADGCEMSDCNENCIEDADDLFELTSLDCNTNGIPDECEMIDCNDNCVDDATDIANLTSSDCNANGAPDECEIDLNSAAPGSPFFCDPAAPPAGFEQCADDCNDNGVPDECEFIDCNENCIDDADDIANLTSLDCNTNNVPDECEPLDRDCNENCIEDADDIANLTSLDCNTNNVPDECEHLGGDCNGNGVPDVCEMSDCNENCIDDADDIADGVSEDCNETGIPDECELASGRLFSADLPGLVRTYGGMSGPYGGYSDYAFDHQFALVRKAWMRVTGGSHTWAVLRGCLDGVCSEDWFDMPWCGPLVHSDAALDGVGGVFAYVEPACCDQQAWIHGNRRAIGTHPGL